MVVLCENANGFVASLNHGKLAAMISEETTESRSRSCACSSCAFWVDPFYRINPPQVVIHVKTNRDAHGHAHFVTYTRAGWPDTLPTEWCGGYKPKHMMLAAVQLFHREEREAFGPLSSRKSGNLCLRLWKWAIRRWGNAWTRLEYEIRSKPNA